MVPREELEWLFGLEEHALVDKVAEKLGNPRFAVVKSYVADRRYELISHWFSVNPAQVVLLRRDMGLKLPGFRETVAWQTISVHVGTCFGRWGEEEADRIAADDLLTTGTPIARGSASTNGISVLVDDPGHEADIVSAVEALAEDVGSVQVLADAIAAAGGGRLARLRDYLQGWFFERHLKQYSLHRRAAPVYWQLATPSASYSIWLYYHHFTRDTLYRVLNDYVIPKLKHEERKLTSLTQEAGPNPTASQRKKIDAQENFVAELRAFRDEVARVTPLWNPDFNDGVIINFAPLWRLVPQHRAWQKECKKIWDKLVAGDYDWAHLAMHLWPERAVPKCAEDRSLAIAHGLEDLFWYEDDNGKWQSRKVDQSAIDKLIEERSSAAVKDALRSLLEAPIPATGRTRKRKAPRVRAARRTTVLRGSSGMSGVPDRGRTTSAPPSDLLNNVKEAIAANSNGASKADVIAATGISSDQWNSAIRALLAEGAVSQTGERRGARYHLAGGNT